MSTHPDEVPAGDELPGLLPPFRPTSATRADTGAAGLDPLPPFVGRRTAPAAQPASAPDDAMDAIDALDAGGTTAGEEWMPWEASPDEAAVRSPREDAEPAAAAEPPAATDAYPDEPEVPAWLDWLDGEIAAANAAPAEAGDAPEAQSLEPDAGYLAFEEPQAEPEPPATASEGPAGAGDAVEAAPAPLDVLPEDEPLPAAFTDAQEWAVPGAWEEAGFTAEADAEPRGEEPTLETEPGLEMSSETETETVARLEEAAEVEVEPVGGGAPAAFLEVAERLESLARTLRSESPAALLARGGGDPLELLVVGFALGYAQGEARAGRPAAE